MRILLVEDEHRISAYVKRGLEESGYAVDAVFTGREALDWAEAGPYDFIVLDIMLPELDGLSVCRELQDRGDRTPVLMLTARDTVDDRVRGLDAGADDYLVKPFAMKELLARLRALTRRVNEQSRSPITTFADLSLNSLPSMYVSGFETAVQTVLEDGVLSEDEENNLDAYMKTLGLGQGDLDGSGAYTTMVKATILREILEGKLPEKFSVSGDLPFNFQKAEKLLWLFQVVGYTEQRTTTRYQGSYQGVSLKVAKGVYYRTGGFRGNPVPVTSTIAVDIGALAVTQKHIYFAGPSKSFRIPYSKMVSITPFSNGIGIHRDAATAKPQLFTTGDGWFTYNLISNLAKAVNQTGT